MLAHVTTKNRIPFERSGSIHTSQKMFLIISFYLLSPVSDAGRSAAFSAPSAVPSVLLSSASFSAFILSSARNTFD